MMDIINNNIEAYSDPAILKSLGEFIQKSRLEQNKTQQEVAKASGLNRSTIVQIENGSGGTMLSFIQILRALQKLHLLVQFTFQPQISPLQLAEMEHHYRKRARSPKKPESPFNSEW